MTLSMSVSSSNLILVCFNIASHVKPGKVYVIIRRIEPITRNASVAEIFKNIGQQQYVRFQIYSKSLYSLSFRWRNGEPLAHVDGVHVSVLKYRVVYQ